MISMKKIIVLILCVALCVPALAFAETKSSETASPQTEQASSQRERQILENEKWMREFLKQQDE